MKKKKRKLNKSALFTSLLWGIAFGMMLILFYAPRETYFLVEANSDGSYPPLIEKTKGNREYKLYISENPPITQANHLDGTPRKLIKGNLFIRYIPEVNIWDYCIFIYILFLVITSNYRSDKQTSQKIAAIHNTKGNSGSTNTDPKQHPLYEKFIDEDPNLPDHFAKWLESNPDKKLAQSTKNNDSSQ